jgi:hypothetical protein
VLSGLIQPFQQPERVIGFFNTYRRLSPVSRDVLRGIAEQFQQWLKGWTERRDTPVVEAPRWGRRDEFVDPYFKGAQPDQVVVVLKTREPARIMTAIGDKGTNRWHLQIGDRWVIQYNVYNQRPGLGRMFVRMCPYLPFSARVCLNQHRWLCWSTAVAIDRVTWRGWLHSAVRCTDFASPVALEAFSVEARKGQLTIRNGPRSLDQATAATHLMSGPLRSKWASRWMATAGWTKRSSNSCGARSSTRTSTSKAAEGRAARRHRFVNRPLQGPAVRTQPWITAGRSQSVWRAPHHQWTWQRGCGHDAALGRRYTSHMCPQPTATTGSLIGSEVRDCRKSNYQTEPRGPRDGIHFN